MFAVGVLRGKPGVHSFELPVPEIKQPDDVLIRVKEVGVDGTDLNMVKYGLQDIAEGRDEMAMGHEVVGIVEEVGRGVKSLVPGDIVAVTVRRGCGKCHPCLHNQSDMCMTGLYTERGIHKLDGFLTPFAVEREQYIVKVPEPLKKLAVFSEPLSIAEKGIEQIRLIQSRLPWSCPHPEHTFLSPEWGKCKTALVIGAGPLGLLATALIRLSKAYTFNADIVPDDSPKANLVKSLRAKYIDSNAMTPVQVVEKCCAPTGMLNIIFEAAGAAEPAIRLIPYMSRSSICVGTGIPRGDIKIELDAAELVRQVVRFNQVIVGSVNSNRSHFEMALRDMGQVNSSFNGILDRMITHRFRIEDYQQAFDLTDPNHIKTVIEVEPWE
ncbi:MAG: alcohol dehydrogenase catalytic domain-containing protein [Chloroflexi bacterium]|nr:alcohol dehydrogenase catalytic domain-containing protein [Chloroflexota bacterium]